jgi:hypothetical protein
MSTLLVGTLSVVGVLVLAGIVADVFNVVRRSKEE